MSGVPSNIREIENTFKETRAVLEDVEKNTRPERVQGCPRLTWPVRRNPVRDMINRIQYQKATLNLLLLGAIKLQIQANAEF
jgi:hypothetical protein